MTGPSVVDELEELHLSAKLTEEILQKLIDAVYSHTLHYGNEKQCVDEIIGAAETAEVELRGRKLT